MSTNKSEPPDSHRSIIRSTSVISAGTLLSRILGFLRDIVLAKLLGTGFRADAFFVALKIPNLFRDLVGEGATNAAVVPVLSQYKEKNKEEFWNFINIVFTLGLIFLSVITLLGILLAPWVVRTLAPGFIDDPEKFQLTVHLTKLIFPYLVFIGLTAYSMGVLYTFRSFWSPAFSPCLLNVAMIVSAVLASQHMKEPVVGMAIGVLIGGLLQLLMQWIPLLKIGLRYQWPKTLKHPGAAQIGKLMIPRLVGGGVYQLSVFIDTFCASLASIVGAGGISAIYYTNRIIQFPMGIFSIALASAVLPSLSGLVNKNDIQGIKKMIVFSLENIFFVMAPTTMILFLLSGPIVHALFERGEFDAYSTHITASALSFYCLGLFSFGGIKILVTAFHAFQDTKTPVKVAALCLTINATLNFVLMYPLKVAGIALASAIAGTIDFLILFYVMRQRLGDLNSGLLGYFLKVSIASLIVGIVEYVSWQYWTVNHPIAKLLFIGFGGFVLYFFVCLTLRVEQAQKIWTWIRKPYNLFP